MLPPQQLFVIYNVLSGTLQKFKWEDCTTVQKGSWGYKRNTDISGYLTAQELIAELVTVVRCIHITYTLTNNVT